MQGVKVTTLNQDLTESQGGSRRPRRLINGEDSSIVRRDGERHLEVQNPASHVSKDQRAAFRIKMGIPAEALVFGSVGRLAQVKGIDRLIAAFAALKLPLSTTYLLLIGAGPEREALERQARELGVADRVIFAGFQGDPAPYLAAMDVFVLPSRSEGVSVALLEAMAAGVPVAVTDVGANREVIEEGRCGVILPAEECQWPEILAALLNDPEGSAIKQQAAKERVRTRYSLATTLDSYEQLYR
jgi:glycosyltransferase involved in cell wall biosynthesis